jgi:hypothetical protein
MAAGRSKPRPDRGPAPAIARCRGCGASFASRYAAKSHLCREPAEPDPERTA